MFTIIQNKHPDGWLIGRKALVDGRPSVFMEYWNDGDAWAGSGAVFPDTVSLWKVMSRLLKESTEAKT